MTLKIAVAAMTMVLGDMDVNVEIAYMNADVVLQKGNPDKLSRDEGAAINFYTQESALYRTLNAILCDRV